MFLSNLDPNTNAQTVIDTLRIRATQVLLGFVFITALLSTIIVQIYSGGFSLQTLLTGSGVLITGAGLVSVQRGYYVKSIGSIIVFYMVISSLAALTIDFDVPLMFLMLASIGAAIIPPRPVFWAVSGVSILGITWFIFFSDLLTRETALVGDPIFAIVITVVVLILPSIISLLLRIFIDRLEQVTYFAQRTATLLEASANIGQSISQTLELDELLNQAVEIVRDRFAFYHVQIFLTDDTREYAYLRASTGQVGEQMLARGHRLRIDSNSVIGRVSLSGEPIIARDADQDSGHAFNELLPDTRSEMAIPIQDNDGIIGALDVQSRLANAFTTNEIRILNVIANQLATAIRNARLFENQTNNIRENKRLFIEAETNLREIQRLNRQLTRQAWTDYLKMDRRITGVTLARSAVQQSR